MNDKHILLVEDDETLQALIKKLLVNNYGLTIKFFESFEDVSKSIPSIDTMMISLDMYKKGLVN